MRRASFLSKIGVICFIGLFGCEERNASDVNQDLTASASINLTVVPADARCLQVTVVQGTTTAVRRFDVSPGQSTTLTLTNLPTGSVTLSEQAFTVACASIGTTTPTWSSNSVAVVLTAGVPADVSLQLQRTDLGGVVTVKSDFPAPVSNQFDEYPMSGLTTTAIGVGPDGRMWFAARVLSPEGSYYVELRYADPNDPNEPIVTAVSLPALSQAQSVMTGADGNVWVAGGSASPSAGSLVQVTSTGSITSFALPRYASQTVLGPNGNFYVATSPAGGILRVTPEGSVTDCTLGGTSATSIAVGSDGNVWFLTADNRVGRLILASNAYSLFAIPTANSGAMSIVPGRDGNLWFSEYNVGRIARITTAGAVTELALPVGTKPTLLTPGADGNIWFSAPTQKCLGKITPAGVVTTYQVSTATFGVSGMVSASDGDIWFIKVLGSPPFTEGRVVRFRL